MKVRGDYARLVSKVMRAVASDCARANVSNASCIHHITFFGVFNCVIKPHGRSNNKIRILRSKANHNGISEVQQNKKKVEVE